MAGWTQFSDELESGEESEWAIVAPTYGDARDVCVEGPSGLLKALGGKKSPLITNWNRSIGELFLANGHKVYIDGADDGALRIQGKNLRGVWCDEVGLWRNWDTAWNESIGFALRIAPARFVATGTPKMGHPLVHLLLNDPATVVTHMRTLDNAANLHPVRLQELIDRWQGTRRGRQELEGEYIEEVLGAVWTLKLIDECRVSEAPDLGRVVVGVDPNGTPDDDTGSSETGIIVAGLGKTKPHRGYILADHSLHGTPHEWASKAVWAYHTYKADRIVAEKNFGGEMVRHTIHSVDRNVPVKLVNASRGKEVRAEPISDKYEQGLIHHVGGRLGDLETQLTTWVPRSNAPSPDRMDALVWALTELMLGTGEAKTVLYRDDPYAGGQTYRSGDLVLHGDRYIDKG